MNKWIQLLLIASASFVLAGVGYAYDCSSTAQYVDGSSYSTGAVVQNNGEAYQCTVGGWCTVGGPYAPGAGWAWTSAWSDLGVCAGGGNPPPSSGNPPPSSGNPPPSSGNPPPSSGNPPPSSGNPPPSSGNPPPSSGGSCTAAAWDASTAYNGGAEVSYDGNLYSAKWWTQGDNPASHSGAWDVWNLEGACTGGGNPPPSSGNPPPSSGNPPPSSGNPPPSSGGSTTIPSFLFSPYKDVGISAHWVNGGFQVATKITGSFQTIVQALGSTNGLDAITYAFATGNCGSERWASLDASTIAASAQAMDAAGHFYIISTGGAAGSFTCGSAAGLINFIQTYYTPHMAGVDFDIEHAPSNINALVQAVKGAQAQYPNMRFSFTLASFGSSTRSGSTLNATGQAVMQAIQSANLTGVYIDLMTMDYGKALPGNCEVVNGVCDMGKSAIAAATKLHNGYGIPYKYIEITPMIGQNDTNNEVFSIEDAGEVAAFAKQVGLGGIHYWSFDRDDGCSGSNVKCNQTGQPVFAFTNAFLSDLGL